MQIRRITVIKDESLGWSSAFDLLPPWTHTCARTHTHHMCVPFIAKLMLQNKKFKTNRDPWLIIQMGKLSLREETTFAPRNRPNWLWK